MLDDDYFEEVLMQEEELYKIMLTNASHADERQNLKSIFWFPKQDGKKSILRAHCGVTIDEHQSPKKKMINNHRKIGQQCLCRFICGRAARSNPSSSRKFTPVSRKRTRKL
jgi:hypothetical protein